MSEYQEPRPTSARQERTARESRRLAYLSRRYVGASVSMSDGRTITIEELYDYEPADPSVGIMSGSLTFRCSDGTDYAVCEDGGVCRADDQTCTTVGYTAPLYDGD